MSLTAISRITLSGVAGAGLAIVAGCAAVGPDYQAPSPPIASAWQAALPHGGDVDEMHDWWASFNDPTLRELLLAADESHPSLARATAAIEAARASRQRVQGSALPSVSATAHGQRAGALDRGGQRSESGVLGLDASWEVDLFGAVRRGREGADARLAAEKAAWHDARISLAAEVASEYVHFLSCKLLQKSDANNLDSLQKTLTSTKTAVAAGLIAPAEEMLAAASVASASAALTARQRECELSIKALVALTGMDEQRLRASLEGEASLPDPAPFSVTTLPVQLLSQRPDLVAVERRLAAASADIGLAQANRYPRLSLLGNLSASSVLQGGDRVQSAPWSFGPSLSLPIFDGGRSKAQLNLAHAAYATALADYQSAVRNAAKEVEQNLIRLASATQRSKELAASAEAYQQYYSVAQQNWQAGSISLLDLELVRRQALQAQQSLIAEQREKLLAGIALYKALGGGWQSTSATTQVEAKQ